MSDDRFERPDPGKLIPINRDHRVQMFCHGCSDSGAILAESTEHPGAAPYAFRCDCSRGQRRKAFPRWADFRDSGKYVRRKEPK